MEFNQAKTPYNSIYAELKLPPNTEDLICCSHGKDCEVNKGKTAAASAVKPDDKNQYVNLASPKKGKLPEKVPEVAVERKTKTDMMSLKHFIVNNIAETKKSRKERKKKRSPLVDDNQSYVTFGNPINSDKDASTTAIPVSSVIPPSSSAPPPTEVTAAESIVSSAATPFARPNEAQSAYIGVLSLQDAENHLTRRGEFALYHLHTADGGIDSRSSGLPLMLIYRTTTKKFRHYPIRPTCDMHYFVDCGYPNVRIHYSLSHLVMYYKTSASLEINPDNTSADSFSWWLE